MKIEITKEHAIMAGGIAGVISAAVTTVVAVKKANDAVKKVKELEREADNRLCSQDEKIVKQTIAVNRITGTFDRTIDELADTIDVTIEQTMIDAAMKKAADDACEDAAREAVKLIKADMRTRIDEEVDTMVENIRPFAESETRRALQKKLNSINIQRLKDDVVRDTKRQLLEQAKTEVDRVTSEFTNQINQQAQFIKTMNEKMTGTS